jgi:tetratricopeptide (TPR) repeat protein
MRRITFAIIAAATCCCLGCLQESSPVQTPAPVAAVKPKQDHFRLAMDYLDRLDEFDPKQAMVQTAYHLNRWLENSEVDTSWQQDPLLDDLPSQIRGIPPIVELAKPQFTTHDVRFLQEASWARSVSRWVVQQPVGQELEPWLQELEKAKGESHAYDVSVAAKLFDWTVRNVQLDVLPAYPTPAAGPAAKGHTGAPAQGSPLELATPGPGYTAFPWQTMLFGRGDAWQRARVFLALCRQQQLTGVMLAWDDVRSSPRPRPWLAAVLVDDQLYLFDPELGLAIPAPGGVGIATLSQVRKDRALLQSLAVGDAHPYAAADADFDKLVVLIDAAPEALSYRMHAAERKASSDNALSLSVPATRIAARIRQCEGVSRIELWKTPFETWIYRTALTQRAAVDAQAMRQLLFEELIFDTLHPMIRGRLQYFRGNLEKREDREGAKGYFRLARVPNAVIDQIDTSEKIQQGLGIVRNRENEQEWKLRLQMHKATAVLIKQTATYWLGIAHYDAHDYRTAADWFQQRVLDVADGGPWKSGARYSLSRAYEVQGDIEAARDALLLDDSPQKHGNLLRARLLRERMERQPDKNTDRQ